MKTSVSISALLSILSFILVLSGCAPQPVWQGQGKFIEKHEVSDLVIQCMDHRFRLMENLWIKKNCGDDADILSWPGASKCLDPANQAVKEATLEAIGLAIEKHEVKTIHLIHHLDCGGYGGSRKHLDEVAEHKFHKTELARSASVILGRYSNVKVRIYLATPKMIEEMSL